jgi:hypothetical protein
MSPCSPDCSAHESSPNAAACAPGPSEAASAIEHQAALDATLFRRERAARELVLELEAGELRLRRRTD